MKKCFKIGGLTLAIELFKDYDIDGVMKVFATKTSTPDVVLRFLPWDTSLLATSEPTGKDVQYKYFVENGTIQAQKMHGSLGYCSIVRFLNDFTLVECGLRYPEDNYTAMMLFQHIPMKVIYAAFDIMLLHSSQIAVDSKSILFTAPSGTGKTTQSNLWRDIENAKQLSGDRSTARVENGVVNTYGFPLDGSNPIFTNRAHPLGAIVVLRQNTENKIERLSGLMAFRYLIEQASVPYWNKELISKATETLYVVLSVVPTYLLRCTPDGEAVKCLKMRLIADGVIGL